MSGRQRMIVAIVTAIAILLLFLVPPVGVVACLVLLMIAPPWGRTIAERTIISLLILIGVVAIAVPRASEVPLTALTAHLGLALFTAAAIALRFIPRLNRTGIPRPRPLEIVIGLFILGFTWWLVSAYVGRSTAEIISGLISSGWDNHGHFAIFSNSYVSGQTAWPTLDGSPGFLQYYPALHGVLWTNGQLAIETAAAATRIDLIRPFIQWSAISFTLSMAAFAWLAGDLAPRAVRLVKPRAHRTARAAAAIAVIAVIAWSLFGSPQNLFNSGFASFAMGVAVLAVTSYLSARSWRSATQLGWFLIPLGALAVNSLWTALVLGLVPAALVVAVAMSRVRRWLGPVWVLASAVLVGGTVWLQGRAITAAPEVAQKGVIDMLGAPSTGMSVFNIGAALAAPVIAVLVGIVLIRSRSVPLGIAIGGSSVMIVLFLLVTFYAADVAGVARLASYYPLKTLSALLLMNAPVLAAGLGAATAFTLAALRRHLYDRAEGPAVSKANAGIIAITAVVGGTSLLGYIGQTPDNGFMNGFTAAPGVMAADWRARGVKDPLQGEVLLAAREALPDDTSGTTLMWDGAGLLPNLWLASLHRTVTVQDRAFYSRLPNPPFDDQGVSYVEFAMRLNPDLKPVLLYLRPASGERVAQLARLYPDNISLVRVPMASSPVCPECSH